MEKILKKYTTIPEHLYVERNADLQLRSIITEMQRPGYVLVARQMGKTNLLFNAKRTLENENRLFVYVDLSNLYDKERDCYRNIINNIIEPNIDLLESIENEIEEIREKNLPAHNEYSRCLRTVLKFFKGDLVIVLDEIDALKSVDYSDNIFAQIRSNYFSRTNFPVFERLTYVLSGVIEPTELIKDRNKSPFNIGDKIYLDDFNKDEHDTFITKSKLKIDKELSDEIYKWTNGNPRLTFDICSEIENEINENINFNIDKLNVLIKKKYLTSFDIAPIDHIRELVKTNKSIRKSINLIHKKNTLEISDEIKKKLYLYGIINSKFDEKTKIKNKIIEFSLSEDWINSIEKLSTDNFNYGLEKIESHDYLEAIESLLEFLTNSNPNRTQIEVCNYNIGFAYYKLNNYEKAINYFSSEFNLPLYKSNSQSLLGICKIGIGKLIEGVEILEEIVKNKTNDFSYRNALLNLANAVQNENNERALILYNQLYESTFITSDEISDFELKQLKSLSLYYQAEILLKQNNVIEALSKIEEAINKCNPSDSLFLNYIKYDIIEIKDESIKTNLVNTIIDNKLKLENPISNILSFTHNSLYYYLDFVFNSTNSELFENLLNYIITNLLHSSNKYEIILETSSISKNNKEEILNYLLKFETELNSDLLIKAVKELTFININNSNKYFIYFEKYLNLFNKNEIVKTDDIYLFAFAIKLYAESSNIKKGLELCTIIDKRIHNIQEENLKFESVIIYYWYTNLYYSLKDKVNSLKYSEIALNLIESSKKDTTSMIDEEGIYTIKEQLIGIKKQLTSTIQVPKQAINLSPVVSSKKYNRNDILSVRYLDGGEKKAKFKHIESDLKLGKCKII